jgi:signal transduction histidine kinase/tetratricopeptide (TPR) repeat protein
MIDAVSGDVPRERIGGRYRLLGFRGAGSEGSVYLAEDLFTSEQVALKLGAADRLAAEYQRGALLAHPHLARVIGLWPIGSRAALSLEYAPEDLAVLRGSPESLIVRHVAEIARALSYLHRRGMVHADVKPQNALLAGPPESRRAILGDLGLAGNEKTSRGSLEYAAPEVLSGGAPSVASDLYSLGVTLHELLSGSNPFARKLPAEVVRAHFDAPPELSASRGLKAVVGKLLAQDPHSRYGQADEVIEALAAASDIELQPDGEGLAADCIGLGDLFSRDGELARFEARLAGVRDGKGALLSIAGSAGSGKSRLLRRFKVVAELAAVQVLLIGAGRGLETLCRWLGVLLDEDRPVEPTLALAQQRLDAVCQRAPLVLLLDDTDADPELRALLARAPAWKEQRLLIAAVAKEAINPSFEQIKLEPLPTALAKAKLIEALGPSRWAERLSDVLVGEGSAYPGELDEAVRDLANRRILERHRGLWELDETRAGRNLEGCLPRSAERAAMERVLALEQPVRTALGIAAVLGYELDRSALSVIAGSEAVAALDRANLLLAVGARLRFPQIAFARAAERALPPELRRLAHRRAAELAASPEGRAVHLFRAGARGCVRSALAAARAKLRAGAPAEAARMYQVACAAVRLPVANRRAALLCERSGDCLALAGDPAASRRAYSWALARGGDPGRIWQKIAKARWQEGQFAQVLEAIRRARAGGADRLALDVVEARAYAMQGKYEPARQLAAEALPLARLRGDAESATRLHHLLGTCAWHRGDGRGAVAEERAAVLIARSRGDRRAEADARAGLGTAYRILAKYRRAALETSLAIELYTALGDERQEALAWNNLGVTHYLAGEWDRALEAWEKFGASKSRTLEEELLRLNNLGYLYRDRGDFPRAKDLLRQALSKIQEAGGYARLEAMVRGNLGEVFAREGELATAEALYSETLEIAGRIDARDERVETERRLAELELLRGNPAVAGERAAAALQLATQTGNRVEQGNLFRIEAISARGRGDAAAADSAVRAARAALEAAGAPLEMARLDCLACLLELDRGEALKAEAALRRARASVERLGAAPDLHEIEQLQRRIEALRHKSLSQVEALTRAVQRLAAPSDPVALLEEVLDQALLLTGAERGFILLSEAVGPPQVAAVRGAGADATLHISRTIADRVFHTGEMVAIADIVGREQLSTQQSILDLGLRSVLCAPIRSGGKHLGILYVDSRQVGVLLSEKDLALLSAFAALAGSALENVRLIDALRRKGELLAHMAHEFRSPLTGIKGYADLVLEEEALPGSLRPDIEVISNQARRLSDLVQRTLEMARMEAGAVRLVRTPVSLPEVAGTAIAGLKPIALMRSVSVTLSAKQGTPTVLGDFDRLVQVVTNLVGNAIQYSPSGKRVWVEVSRGEPLRLARGPRIEVEGEPSRPSEHSLRPSTQVTVADEGPGIPATSLEKLFTPFFRAGQDNTNGTGLGLVITREIVRQHGGEIRIESQVNRGTTFTLVLPGMQ